MSECRALRNLDSYELKILNLDRPKLLHLKNLNCELLEGREMLLNNGFFLSITRVLR